MVLLSGRSRQYRAKDNNNYVFCANEKFSRAQDISLLTRHASHTVEEVLEEYQDREKV